MDKCPECGNDLELDFDFGDVVVIGCWVCGYSMPQDEVKKIVSEESENE